MYLSPTPTPNSTQPLYPYPFTLEFSPEARLMTMTFHHAGLQTGLEASTCTEKLTSLCTQGIHFYHVSR